VVVVVVVLMVVAEAVAAASWLLLHRSLPLQELQVARTAGVVWEEEEEEEEGVVVCFAAWVLLCRRPSPSIPAAIVVATPLQPREAATASPAAADPRHCPRHRPRASAG